MAKKNEIVPYDQVSASFEAVYTSETSSAAVQKTELITTIHCCHVGWVKMTMGADQ